MGIKEQFISWLKKQRNTKGDYFAEASINIIVRPYENCIESLGIHDVPYVNVFDYDNLSEFEVVYDKILNSPLFRKSTKDGGNYFTQHAQYTEYYIRFLKEFNGICNHITVQEYFIKVIDEAGFERKSYPTISEWSVQKNGKICLYYIPKKNGNLRLCLPLSIELNDLPVSVIKEIPLGSTGKYTFPDKFPLRVEFSECILRDVKQFLDDILEKLEIITKNGNEKKNKDKMNDKPSLNQILYGPPGTGKTYNTVIEAMKIIDKPVINIDKDGICTNYSDVKKIFDDYKNDGRIQFVTFHQSYSYEEFVEGIKPKTTQDGKIIYEVQDGIFKKICNEAKQIKAEKTSDSIDFSKTRIFKMSLGAVWENDVADIYSYCLENNVIALGWGRDKDFSECVSTQDFKNLDNTWGAKAVEIFKNWMRIGDVVLISNGVSNIKAIARITGEYEYRSDSEIRYHQFRSVEWLYFGDDIP
ncbi:MAG: hypothetical protein IJW73_05525, partial [Candidatus Gastranaerophilales bacterium]|nr:hypothetical protein [Candidatus Gastranaerophilales bacterium]